MNAKLRTLNLRNRLAFHRMGRFWPSLPYMVAIKEANGDYRFYEMED